MVEQVEGDRELASAERQWDGAGRMDDPGQRLDAIDQFLNETVLLVGVVARFGEIEAGGENVFRIQSQVHPGQAVKTADEQAGTHEQRHAQCSFEDH
jgi:hypothetical protein